MRNFKWADRFVPSRFVLHKQVELVGQVNLGALRNDCTLASLNHDIEEFDARLELLFHDEDDSLEKEDVGLDKLSLDT